MFDFWNYLLSFGILGLYLQHKDSIGMRIIARSTLVAYYQKEPRSRVALEMWYQRTREAQWNNFADVKNTFGSVDNVGNQHYVFNIHGNDFRLVVVIKFTPHTVYIRFVGNHSEYDKIKDISNI